jgi:hypothetical protein
MVVLTFLLFLSIVLHQAYFEVQSGGHVLHTEKPKDSTKSLLELINKFCKVAKYKTTIQKSVSFLRKFSKKEIMKQLYSQ